MPIPTREGSALARSEDGRELYLADEDHSVVRVLSVLAGSMLGDLREVAMPGRPASVLTLGERVLVTTRDPGRLLVMRRDEERGLKSEHEIPVPVDAWGVALSEDQQLAVVSSASAAHVSAIDLTSMRVRWSLPVAREPRGVVITGDRAYVTHLVGAELTRIDDIDGEAVAKRVALPAAPTRTAPDRQHAASLGYAATLSPDARLLFAPRRAIGGLGRDVWAGVPAVDILDLKTDEPLATTVTAKMKTPRNPWSFMRVADPERQTLRSRDDESFQQPRAVVYRKLTNTLVVACEGEDTLVELDALAVDPALDPLRRYRFVAPRQSWIGNTQCGAPTAVVLTPDELTAYVYCRSTDGIARVDLATQVGGRTHLSRRDGGLRELPWLAGDRSHRSRELRTVRCARRHALLSRRETELSHALAARRSSDRALLPRRTQPRGKRRYAQTFGHDRAARTPFSHALKEVAIRPGTVVFFNGDKLRHRVTPLGPGERRVVLTMQYVSTRRMHPLKRLISNLKDALTYFGLGVLKPRRKLLTQ